MDTIEIDNTEVTDVTDVAEDTTATDELHVRPELLPGVAPVAEEDAAEASTEVGEAVVATGAPVVSEPVVLPACEFEDSENCVWNAETSGNGEGNSFVDIDGTVVYFDYTDVYANDGFIVDCEAMVTTHWYEQTVMGFKVEEDGSITMYDLGYETEHFEDLMPTTHDEYMGRCWVPPVEEPELPELVEVPEVTITTPVTVDHAPAQEELAVTGGVDMLTPLLVGSALLLTGAALMIRKKFKRA